LFGDGLDRRGGRCIVASRVVQQQKEKNMSMVTEFREFAVKGNMVDMAVGIIIGGAFGKIVNSLVADVIMPPIGMLLGQVDFKDLAITMKEATVDAAGADVAAVTLNYGMFVQNGEGDQPPPPEAGSRRSGEVGGRGGLDPWKDGMLEGWTMGWMSGKPSGGEEA